MHGLSRQNKSEKSLAAVEALEQAAYDPEMYQGWIGVYAGLGVNSYF